MFAHGSAETPISHWSCPQSITYQHILTQKLLLKSLPFLISCCFTALTQLWQEGEEGGCDAEQARLLIGILSLPANHLTLL